ncbi:MAG: bifunctional 5,10-methylenetetrahydrofolate dehydrogenase/5,10-methenyltetrahydrofolate cyclohydrolase [Candidatus Thermoplasmatota archaeon]|nr:bifunctional 5,10-methylenetetrahydrofolate dehydrogenase/5,10-methenyltetrahydrofolate cyclohydrolase [Candidatus Thermoplasmatota archaeon]
MHLIHGKHIARQMEEDIRRRIGGRTLSVSTLMMEGSQPSALYARLKEEACRRAGIAHRTLSFPPGTEQREMIKKIRELNRDPAVHGIMVQQPLPGVAYEQVVAAIDPAKDVEGMHPLNLGRTLLGDEHLVPGTPRAVLTILEHEGIELEGREAVIVNHSAIVGKPLAALMLSRNATVSVCHVYTRNLAAHTRQADVLVTGAGVKGLITGEHLKPGSVVVDVAIIPDGEGVTGDVDRESVAEVAGALTPVPGGVGPVTIACMLENVLRAASIEKD